MSDTTTEHSGPCHAVGAPVERPVRLDPKRAALAEVVEAWESLKGGRYYGPRAVEAWLAGPMLKAINKARLALTKAE